MKSISPVRIVENQDSREAYLSITYRLSDEEYSSSAVELALELLIESGATFASRKQMAEKCANLYGMTYESSFVHSSGNYYINFKVSSVDEAYIKTFKKLRLESVKLLKKVLSSGIRESNEVLNRLKSDLVSQVTDICQSPSFKVLAGIQQNIIDNFYPGTLRYGTEKMIAETSFSDIQKVLDAFKMPPYEIVYLGRKDKSIETKIHSLFTLPATIDVRKREIIKKPNKVEDFTGKTPFPQSELALVYNGSSHEDEKSLVVENLALAILANSATSRLFQKIREEMHLVYDIGATKFSSAVIISVPMKQKNYKITLAAVKNTIEELKKGITESELTNAKYQYKHTLTSLQSHPAEAIDFLSSLIQLSYTPDLEEYLTVSDSITQKDVVDYLQSLDYCGSYFVKGTGE